MRMTFILQIHELRSNPLSHLRSLLSYHFPIGYIPALAAVLVVVRVQVRVLVVPLQAQVAVIRQVAVMVVVVQQRQQRATATRRPIRVAACQAAAGRRVWDVVQRRVPAARAPWWSGAEAAAVVARSAAVAHSFILLDGMGGCKMGDVWRSLSLRFEKCSINNIGEQFRAYGFQLDM